MSDWPTIGAGVNAVMQNAFGEPVVYQPVQAGFAVGDPFTIAAVRHIRVKEESGAKASVEEISVNAADFANFAQTGDWVTGWGSQFVVRTVRQPDPYGLVEISLFARQGADDQP